MWYNPTIIIFEFFVAQLRDYRLIAKYVISGSIAAVSQLGMLVFLVERFHLWHILAVVYAFLFSATIAFCLQKFWTFSDRSLSKAHFQAALYAILLSVALSLNVMFMYFFCRFVARLVCRCTDNNYGASDHCHFSE